MIVKTDDMFTIWVGKGGIDEKDKSMGDRNTAHSKKSHRNAEA